MPPVKSGEITVSAPASIGGTGVPEWQLGSADGQPRAILVTQAIPVLGNGKIDYGSTRELAASRRSLL